MSCCLYIGGGGVNKMNELPNYTGPYISNGKFQESVAFGDVAPKDALDALSRLHDSAYAKYKDQAHRMAADALYEKETKKLVGLFPEIAGDLVLYGNQIARSSSNLLNGFGLPGLIYGGVKNMIVMNDYMNNATKYKKEITDYYKTDPYYDKYQGVYQNKPIVNDNRNNTYVPTTMIKEQHSSGIAPNGHVWYTDRVIPGGYFHQAPKYLSFVPQDFFFNSRRRKKNRSSVYVC